MGRIVALSGVETKFGSSAVQRSWEPLKKLAISVFLLSVSFAVLQVVKSITEWTFSELPHARTRFPLPLSGLHGLSGCTYKATTTTNAPYFAAAASSTFFGSR